jgi:hypothetical protein
MRFDRKGPLIFAMSHGPGPVLRGFGPWRAISNLPFRG